MESHGDEEGDRDDPLHALFLQKVKGILDAGLAELVEGVGGVDESPCPEPLGVELDDPHVRQGLVPGTVAEHEDSAFPVASYIRDPVAEDIGEDLSGTEGGCEGDGYRLSVDLHVCFFLVAHSQLLGDELLGEGPLSDVVGETDDIVDTLFHQ